MRLQRLAGFVFPLALLVALTVAVAGCTDNTSNIGSQYFPDSVQFQTVTKQDTNLLKFANSVSPTFTTLGRPFNITSSSPVMLVGRSRIGTDNLESWGILRFPFLPTDSAQHLTKVRLLLKEINYKFGDTTNSIVDLKVYNVEGDGKITDSTATIPSYVLSQTPIGTVIDPAFKDSSNNQLAIDIAPSIYPDLVAASFAYVLVPGNTMTNVRGFGTSDFADTNGIPKVEYTFTYGTTVTTLTRKPVLDLHVVEDKSVTPQGEFTLRGSIGRRESINFNFNAPNDTLKLDPFATINNAVLVLRFDPANSQHSSATADTVGPSVVQLLNANDTSGLFIGEGVKDASDPTLYRFQLRTLLQYWLRNPSQNFGIQLRAGYNNRQFITSSTGVEDNTLNRWTFYGSDAADPNNRPKIILSYSKLK